MSNEKNTRRPPLTEEQILDAVGLVEEELLQEADVFRQGGLAFDGERPVSEEDKATETPGAGHGNVWRYVGPILAMAACIGIVFGMTKFGLLFNPDSMMGTQQSAPAAASEEATAMEEAGAEEEAVAEETADAEEAAVEEAAPAEAVEEALEAEESIPAQIPAAGQTAETTATEAAKFDNAARENGAEDFVEEAAASDERTETVRIEENEDGTVTVSASGKDVIYRMETENKAEWADSLGEIVFEDENAVWYRAKESDDMSALIRQDAATGAYTLWTATE